MLFLAKKWRTRSYRGGVVGLLLFTCNFPSTTRSFCPRHFEFPVAVNFSVLPLPFLCQFSSIFYLCFFPATNRVDLHNSAHISTHSLLLGCLHIFWQLSGSNKLEFRSVPAPSLHLLILTVVNERRSTEKSWPTLYKFGWDNLRGTQEQPKQLKQSKQRTKIKFEIAHFSIRFAPKQVLQIWQLGFVVLLRAQSRPRVLSQVDFGD